MAETKTKAKMKEEQDRKNYKSPKRKLVKFFEKSRDKWKTKHQEVKKNVKQLKNRVNYFDNVTFHKNQGVREVS